VNAECTRESAVHSSIARSEWLAPAAVVVAAEVAEVAEVVVVVADSAVAAAAGATRCTDRLSQSCRTLEKGSKETGSQRSESSNKFLRN
jgi:hypothetical protein